MSDTTPSGPPPSSPPPPGPPPTWVPPSAPPMAPPTEYLGGGSAPPPPPGAGSGGSGGGGRRKAWIAGGVTLAVVAAVGGYVGYQAVFASGPQPAEALPDSTVAYLSVDLDPSGKQKYEALQALQKFPGFSEETGLDRDSDLRRELFESIQDAGACPDVDWGDDIEPWLGNRFGVAAVDLGDDNFEGAPVTPVAVVQISGDEDAAEDGLEKLRDCGNVGMGGLGMSMDPGLAGSTSDEPSSSDEVGGWVVRDGWIVVAPTQDLAEQVSDDAAESPLTDDDDYERWTDAVGDVGILNGYAAPEAGKVLGDALAEFSSFTVSCSATSYPVDPDDPYASEDDPYDDPYDEYCDEEATEEQADAVREMFADFDGAAMAVRFADEGMEIETASSTEFGGYGEYAGTDRGDDIVAGLPDDTAIAAGAGFEQGWFEAYLDYVSSINPMGEGLDEMLEVLEEVSGLALPEDVETLAGESAAVAIGPDVDIEQLDGGNAEGLPLAFKVQGDSEAIDGVLQKLLAAPEVDQEFKDSFAYSSDGDTTVGGFDPDWNAEVADGGDLGGTDLYQDVVPESEDASAVLFVNFNAGDWVSQLARSDEDAQELLEPLAAAGMSVWTDDDVVHSLVKITTD